MISALNNYRSLFISDIHLGSHNCKAERLYNFLLSHNAKRIYLVGDLVEELHLKRWPPFHNDILQLLGQRSSQGVEIIFIPGNHDSIFRHHLGTYGKVIIAKDFYHHTVDDRVMYVIHGDEIDALPHYLWLGFITTFEPLTGIGLWELLR